MSKIRGYSRVLVSLASIAVLAAISIVTVVGVRTDGASASSNSEAVDGEQVTARSLWGATLSGLDCIRSDGFRTVGPFPGADGVNVHYSVEVGISDSDRAAQGQCLEAAVSLAARFAALNGSPVDVKLGQDPNEPPTVDIAPSETAEGRELLQIRDSLVRCLGLPDNATDDHLLRLAHDEGDRFDGCVESLR